MKAIVNYTVCFAIALTFGWAFMEVREWLQEPTAPLPVEGEEWCLIDILDSAGGQIVSNRAGEDTYRVIGTTRGFEVYQKCAKN